MLLKKIVSGWLLLMVAVCVSTAQEFIISEPVKIGYRDISYEILGNYNDKMLVFRDRGDEFEVMSYSPNLAVAWTKEIKLEGKKTQILTIIPNKNYFSIIYKSSKKSGMYVKIHRYNGNCELIDSVTIKDYSHRYDINTPQVVKSEDKSRIFVFHTSYNYNKTIEGVVFQIDKMNAEFEFLHKIDKVEEERFQPILLSNKGQVFIANIVEKDSKHQLDVAAFEKGKPPLFWNFPLHKQYFFDAMFTLDNLNQKILAIGFYSDKNRNRAKGVIYISNSFALTTTTATVADMPFQDALVSQVLEKKVQNHNGIPEIKVNQIILRKDGGCLFVAEQKRVLEHQLGNGRAFRGDPYRIIFDYYNDNILLYSLHPSGHPDGVEHWISVLTKKQFSSDDDGIFSSYFLMKTSSGLRLIFNDEIAQGTTVSEYLVLPNGQTERHSLFSTERQDIQLRFMDAYQLSANEVIVPSDYKNKIRFVKIKF